MLESRAWTALCSQASVTATCVPGPEVLLCRGRGSPPVSAASGREEGDTCLGGQTHWINQQSVGWQGSWPQCPHILAIYFSPPKIPTEYFAQVTFLPGDRLCEHLVLVNRQMTYQDSILNYQQDSQSREPQWRLEYSEEQSLRMTN